MLPMGQRHQGFSKFFLAKQRHSSGGEGLPKWLVGDGNKHPRKIGIHIIYIYMYQYINIIYIYNMYGNYILIYGLLNIRSGILDYLGESFPWPARPFKHTESNSLKHTVSTFKYTNWYFILPPGPRGLARPPHFKCRYRIYIYIISYIL